ncbi:hypothetical protein AURDEDRAFT_157134 [Auricularia subglabra TFB-10046 SS5]|nr:hypothetical protein AURDEDRAFT_157134 [Auricularia subglabra TFB-10046 SS5]
MDALNDEQIEILETEYRVSRNLGELRVPVRRSSSAAVRAGDVGPLVTSQFVGRWFANRARDDAGRPRLQRKTPEQLAVLEESFINDPYPDSEELTRIIRVTLLSKRQVTAWFCTERKKNPEIIEARRLREALHPATLPPGIGGKGINSKAIERHWKQIEKERPMELERFSRQEETAVTAAGGT